MTETYHVVSTHRQPRAARFPAARRACWPRTASSLLPMLDLLEHAQAAIDDLIDVMGRATIEAVLLMSARPARRAQAAGQEGRPRHRLSRHAARPRGPQGTPTPRREAPAPQEDPEPESRARSRSPPTRRCGRTAGWPTACSRS